MTRKGDLQSIFDPVTLGRLRLKNRVIRSATWEALADDEGHMSEEIYQIYDELASGGVGCIITGFTSVSRMDSYVYGAVKLSSDDLIPEHARLVDTVHTHHCPVIVQPALGGMSMDDMTLDDIHRVKDMFTSAALRAHRADYDEVQIHSAHGFFLSRTIGPAFNSKNDSYGGSAENRARLLLEIISSIREQLPGLHVSTKINSSDFMPGGLDESESLKVCKLFEAAGLEAIEVSGSGTSVPGIRSGINEGYFSKFGLMLAEKVNIPVIVVGGFRSIY